MDKNTANSILEKVVSDYDNIADRFSQTRYKEWGEFADFEKYVKAGDSVLDVGCGNGRLLEFLAKQNIKYTGIDTSERLINIAKNKSTLAAQNTKTMYNYITASAISLPFSDEEFNIVFAIASLYHIPSKEYREQAVGEIYRVLKPGGMFIMTYWNMWERSRRGLVAKNILNKIIFKSNLDFFDAEKPWRNPDGKIIATRYCHAFRLNEIKNIGRRSGFELVDSYYYARGEKVSAFKGFNGVYLGKKR